MTAPGQQARIWAKKILPESVVKVMRSPHRLMRSWIRRAKRNAMEPLDLTRLVADLRRAGIEAGDVVIVHSSLSRIGNVLGGATTVIRSIIEAVSPGGTVIMPCYNSADEAVRRSNEGNPIDLRTARSATGIITETFRTWPGVFRSSHPFSSACAWGDKAEFITSGHDSDPHVCHAASPVGRLVALKGKVVGIAIPIAQGLGIAHYLEDTWDDFPFEVHSSNLAITYIDSGGKTIRREICRFDPKVAQTRIDYPAGKWICETLTSHLARRGILKPFRFGEVESWAMEAVSLYEELKRLATKGMTMYLTKGRLTERNRDIENW